VTESEVIQIMRAHIETLFPRMCTCCRRPFQTLPDFLRNTQPLGSAMSYDAAMGDWLPDKPLGLVSYSNCACGNTIALSSAGMPLFQLWEILHWAREQTHLRGITQQELFDEVRTAIVLEVLASAPPEDGARI
jgi:hypothetical protein